MIVAATTAPVLAAEDPVEVAPATEQVVPAGKVAEEPAAPPSVAADQTAENPRPAPEAVETEEIPDAEQDREGPRRRKQEPERGDDEPKQPLAGANVSIKNFKYKPDPVRINAGDSVTWTNRDSAQHSATDEGEFDTGLLKKNESGTVKIEQAGTYNYLCTVHPDMRAKLIAEGGGSGGNSGTGNSSDSGGTSSESGGSVSALGSGSGGSSESGSRGSLPRTGQEQLPLLILGAGLIALGLLTRAFHEHWIWR